MHRSTNEGRAFFLMVMIFTAPMKLPGLVTVAVTLVPAASFFLRNFFRLTVPLAFFLVKDFVGHFLPLGALQVTLSVEPAGMPLTASCVNVVNEFVDFCTKKGIEMTIRVGGGDFESAPSQFSSMPLSRMSATPGLMAGLLSSQSAGRWKPSP